MMAKPPWMDWTQAPDWAKWWAMDATGNAYWYEEKPIESSRYFHTEGNALRAPGFGWDSDRWVESLVERLGYEGDEPDYVDHPPHYTTGDIECIEVLEQLAEDGHDFRILNAIKYLCRYRHKGGVESLAKARWYIERVINDG